MIDHHFQKTIQNLQKLHDKTPRSLVLLMAGCLPGEAILHIKQLTLFSMICHLPSDPLHLHGRAVLLSAPPSARSWFQQILTLCLKYSLGHPHQLLFHPPPKSIFKRKIKAAVINFWEDTLRQEASSLDSLHMFVPFNCNLQQPHPLWTTAGSNSFECHKSAVLARMISGRFRTEYLSRHWTNNKQGHCQLDTCLETVGDLEHLLISCPALAPVRTRMRETILTRTMKLIPLNAFILRILVSSPAIQLQFFLEPLAFIEIVNLCDIYGQTVLDLVYYCVRTYVYYVHRQKQIMLGLWPGDISVKTGHNKKFLRFRKPDIQQSNEIACTNTLSFPGQLRFPNTSQILPVPIPDLVHGAQPHTSNNTTTSLDPAAVPDVGSWGCGLPGDTGQSAALDCIGVIVDYSGEGRAADCCHGSQIISYSDTLLMDSSCTVVAQNAHSSNTFAGVSHHGRVVQLSSSYHTSSHHHQGSGTQ